MLNYNFVDDNNGNKQEDNECSLRPLSMHPTGNRISLSLGSESATSNVTTGASNHKNNTDIVNDDSQNIHSNDNNTHFAHNYALNSGNHHFTQLENIRMPLFPTSGDAIFSSLPFASSSASSIFDPQQFLLGLQHASSSSISADVSAEASALTIRPGELFLSSAAPFHEPLLTLSQAATAAAYNQPLIPLLPSSFSNLSGSHFTNHNNNVSSNDYNNVYDNAIDSNYNMDDSKAVKRAKEKYPWLVIIGPACHSDRYVVSQVYSKTITDSSSFSQKDNDNSNNKNIDNTNNEVNTTDMREEHEEMDADNPSNANINNNNTANDNTNTAGNNTTNNSNNMTNNNNPPVKRKYRRMYCAICAKFNSLTPWANLKARKFEHDSFKDHENSNHHQHAIDEANARKNATLNATETIFSAATLLNLNKPNRPALNNISTSAANNGINSLYGDINYINSWLFASYDPVLAANAMSLGFAAAQAQQQQEQTQHVDTNTDSNTKVIDVNSSQQKKENINNTNNSINTAANNNDNNTTDKESNNTTNNNILPSTNLSPHLNNSLSGFPLLFPALCNNNNNNNSNLFATLPLAPLDWLVPSLSTTSLSASSLTSSQPFQNSLRPYGSYNNITHLSSHQKAQRALSHPFLHPLVSENNSTHINTINGTKARKVEPPEWLLVRGKLRHSEKYLATLQRFNNTNNNTNNNSSDKNINDINNKTDNNGDKKTAKNHSAEVDSEDEHLLMDTASPDGNDDNDNNSNDNIGTNSMDNHMQTINIDDHIRNSKNNDVSNENVSPKRPILKKKYRECCCKYCAEFQPGTPWSLWKPRKYELTVFSLHEKSPVHKRAMAIYATDQHHTQQQK